MTVVVDVTDWGYRVGEIEVVVADRGRVKEATRQIEELAREMSESGFTLRFRRTTVVFADMAFIFSVRSYNCLLVYRRHHLPCLLA